MKRYSDEMYCRGKYFITSVHFEPKPLSWGIFCDIISGGSPEEFSSLKKKIDCAYFLSKDMQKENILKHYDL